jgi:Na+-driven multidrug efflux pump
MTKESLREFATNTRSCAIDNIAMRATLMAISGVTARIGSFQMAIYSVGTYLLNVNFAMGNGLQTASVTLIGRSYGEGNEDHLYGFRRAILKIGLIASIALALVIIFGGRFFYAFFSTDEEFITIGGYSCIFIGIITIFQVIKFINTGCLQGIGKMKEVAFCSIVSFAGVNLGLVALLVLVFKIGIWGVWIGTLCSQATQAFMLWLFIRKVPAFSKKPSK